MDLIWLEKKNDQILRHRIWQFKPMFTILNIFTFFLIFSITLIIFFPPLPPVPACANGTFNLGFYWINTINDQFTSIYINFLAIIITIIAIFYIFYCCLFYWVYWNKGWNNKYKNNPSIIFYIAISIFTIIGGLIIGFVNSPYINFKELTPSLGLDNSSNLEGIIHYNFIYNCSFVKDQTGIIKTYHFSITQYGILDIVIESCLLFLLLVNTIIIAKRKK